MLSTAFARNDRIGTSCVTTVDTPRDSYADILFPMHNPYAQELKLGRGLTLIPVRSFIRLLAFLLSLLPALCSRLREGQEAGQIRAFIPLATRMPRTDKVNDGLEWNDRLGPNRRLVRRRSHGTVYSEPG